jgi:hypothetical protein
MTSRPTVSRSGAERKTARSICFLYSSQRTLIKDAINFALLTIAEFGTRTRRPDLSAVEIFPYHNGPFLLEHKHKKLLREKCLFVLLNIALCSAYYTVSACPRGGGIEYFHRSPASRKRRQKGNPVPGGITGPLCSWGT